MELPAFSSEHILSSCSGFTLKGSMLEALCLGLDGKMHTSRINLNAHISNEDGGFSWFGADFSRSTRNMSLEMRDNGVFLSAQLRSIRGEWVESEVDLSLHVVNIGGRGRLEFSPG